MNKINEWTKNVFERRRYRVDMGDESESWGHSPKRRSRKTSVHAENKLFSPSTSSIVDREMEEDQALSNSSLEGHCQTKTLLGIDVSGICATSTRLCSFDHPAPAVRWDSCCSRIEGLFRREQRWSGAHQSARFDLSWLVLSHLQFQFGQCLTKFTFRMTRFNALLVFDRVQLEFSLWVPSPLSSTVSDAASPMHVVQHWWIVEQVRSEFI